MMPYLPPGEWFWMGLLKGLIVVVFLVIVGFFGGVGQNWRFRK